MLNKFPASKQVGQWRDWSEEDKSRYKALNEKHNNHEHIPPEDYRWYSLRRRNLRFFSSIKSNFIRRRMYARSGGGIVMGGQNTAKG